MAVPYEYFQTHWGIALMRYQHSTGEWFFECWSTKRALVRDLGEGGHSFQLWMILGGSVVQVMSMRYNGWCNIYAIKYRK
ncbi:hypothetical protein [Roseococcus pinisoli]|uniref:Uncharacterized protein n=1 Tax=Roseococcus pinisoli TaxID=2835040 RepID=A0ABS5QF62_9PROT|nr:hypothetical protein [Roseococcus pinisoli]MBS7812340.1 hypothetical protein [Roseococcus pinisoli]